MATFAIYVGVALMVLGVAGYLATGMASVTALIPSFFGLAMFILGWVGRAPERRKLMMHIAATVALIGFFGSARGIAPFVHLVSGGVVERPAAAIAQTLMALICVAFVGFGVKSFVDARRRQAAGSSDGQRS